MNRFDECIKLQKMSIYVRGLFKPETKYCRNNCNEKTCKWWKK